jgi:hypothetical protein
MSAAVLTAPTTRFAEGDFSVGHFINRAVFMLSRNSVTFGALALGVTLTTVLLRRLEKTYPALSLLVVLIVGVGLSLAQAAIAYGTSGGFIVGDAKPSPEPQASPRQPRSPARASPTGADRKRHD